MNDETFGGTDDADVHGVVSLGDRRRIKDLEREKANLEARVAELLGQVKPAMHRKIGECYHSAGFTISDKTPEVTCDQCGAIVDPYMVLRKISDREVNFCYTLNSLRKEREVLDVEVRKLRETKARIKRTLRGATDTPPAGIGKMLRDHELAGISIGQVGSMWNAVAHVKLGAKKQELAKDPESAIAALAERLAEPTKAAT